MTTAREARLRRLEQRAQVGKDAPVKVGRIIITDPDPEHSAEIWNADEPKARRVGDGPITEIRRVIVSPPARDLN